MLLSFWIIMSNNGLMSSIWLFALSTEYLQQTDGDDIEINNDY